MYLDYYEKRKYVDNLLKQWRSEVKNKEYIVLGSREGSDCISAFNSIIAFYEDKKDSLANSIKDRIEAIDESIEIHKELTKKVENNPDYFKY